MLEPAKLTGMDVTRLKIPTALVFISLLAATGCSAGEPEAEGSASSPSEDSSTAPGDDAAEEFPVPDAANQHGGVVLTSPTEVAEGDALGTQSRDDVPEDSELPGGLEEPTAGEPMQMVIFTMLGSDMHAANFEAEHGDFIEELLDSGEITVEFRLGAVQHPAAWRSGAAAACVVDESPEDYFSFVRAVADQNLKPRLEDDEPTDEDLIHFAEQVGVPQAEDCITDRRYTEFVSHTFDVASAGGVGGLPMIYLGGEEWPMRDQDFQPWVQSLLDAHD